LTLLVQPFDAMLSHCRFARQVIVAAAGRVTATPRPVAS
jgi:hypothetical protein